MAANSTNPEAVKLVLIDTQYVQTDPTSFKSVVQSLTGKDSCVAWIEKSSFTGGAKRKNKNAFQLSSSGIDVPRAVGGLGDSNISKVLSKGLSFKDLDRMMQELPSTEDLQFWLWDYQ